MSEKEKKTEEKRKKSVSNLSRREFLKDVGLFIGGTTIGSVALAAGTDSPVQAEAPLDRNPDPTEADVGDTLGGNSCQCSTYQQHPPAVMEAA